MTLLIPICLALLLLSGFFSASETALMSLSRADLKRLGGSDRTGRLVCTLLERPQYLLRTILVCNMFVNVLFASLFAALLNALLENSDGSGVFETLGARLMPGLGASGIHRFGSICRMLLNILIVTPALMLCGEHTPKLIAYSSNVAVSRLAAYPLAVLCVAVYPLNALLRGVANLFLQMMGQDTDDVWGKMTSDELMTTISVSKESGATSDLENQALSRIVGFGGICVDEVMTPRTKVLGLDERLTLREAYAIARKHGHTWYPVYRDNLDGVWGLLSLVDYPHWKDRPEMELSLAQFRKRLGHNVHLKNAVMKPRYVPKSAHIDRLLRTMRQEERSVAIVVDEHGGMEGIVTLNDIVSELLGTLPAHEAPPVTRREDGTFLVDGTLHLRELEKHFENMVDPDDEDSVTLGGLMMERLGRIPCVGDTVTLEDGRLLRVHGMSGKRISLVEIREPQKPEEVADEH